MVNTYVNEEDRRECHENVHDCDAQRDVRAHLRYSLGENVIAVVEHYDEEQLNVHHHDCATTVTSIYTWRYVSSKNTPDECWMTYRTAVGTAWRSRQLRVAFGTLRGGGPQAPRRRLGAKPAASDQGPARSAPRLRPRADPGLRRSRQEKVLRNPAAISKRLYRAPRVGRTAVCAVRCGGVRALPEPARARVPLPQQAVAREPHGGLDDDRAREELRERERGGA